MTPVDGYGSLRLCLGSRSHPVAGPACGPNRTCRALLDGRILRRPNNEISNTKSLKKIIATHDTSSCKGPRGFVAAVLALSDVHAQSPLIEHVAVEPLNGFDHIAFVLHNEEPKPTE